MSSKDLKLAADPYVPGPVRLLDLLDLGTHQLKDLVAPERVWQLCALAAYGENERFRDWARGWLAGTHDHAAQAGALADQLEAEAGRPEITMAARAARAAALAGGRGDEVDTRVIDCAAEAIGRALRMTRLDLSSLALQAVPSS